MSRWKKSTPDRPARWSDPRWLVQDIKDAYRDEYEAAASRKEPLATEGTAYQLLREMAEICEERESFIFVHTVGHLAFLSMRSEDTVRLATRELEARQFIEVVSGPRVKGETRQGPNTYILHPWLGSWRRDANRLHIAPKRRVLAPPKDMPDVSDYEHLRNEQTLTVSDRDSKRDTWDKRQQTLRISESIPRVGDPDENPEKKPETAPLESTNAGSNRPASLDQKEGHEVNDSEDLDANQTPVLGACPSSDDDEWMPNPDNLPPPPAERGSGSEQVREVTFVDASRRVRPKTSAEREILALAAQVDDSDVRDSIEKFDRNQLQTIAYSDVLDARGWSERERWLRSLVWDDENGSPYPCRFPIQVVHFRIAERREISLLRVLGKLRNDSKSTKVRRKSWARELADMLLYPDTKDKATYGWAAEHVVRKDLLKRHPKDAEDMRTNAENYVGRLGIGLHEWPPYARESHTGRCQPAQVSPRIRSTLPGAVACQESANV